MMRRRRAMWRVQVIEHYGGVCTCCGETNPAFLSVDHVNNDGAEHRLVTNNTNICGWLVRNGFPDGFTVLCYNCNLGRQHAGLDYVCPHNVSE
jgi:hypothetical protein